MKILRLVAVGCLAGTILAARGQSTPEKPSRPSVFLVTIDTLRADHVGCYGYSSIRTPALDGLARDGIRFRQAFTPSPITNTSHATILTGLLPSSHGVTDFAVPLGSMHPTLAQLLRQQGYHTAAFIGAVILDSKTLAPGFDRGFDFYDDFPAHPQTSARWGRVERRGMDVVRRAETWLSAHPAGPHFVWVHLYDPHDPYEPPPPYSNLYKDRLYDGEIAYADSALSTFLAYLRKRSWYESALVIVVADHGEGLGEHREETHGIFLYDSTTHVPLILKLSAEQDRGRVIDAQVRTTDIVPTVLDLLGMAEPARLDGTSLRPYFAGRETADRTVFGETDYPLRFGWAPLRSIRAEGSKFIEAPRPEFYDLRSDPGELNNQYQPWNPSVKNLRTMLAEMRAKNPPSLPSAGTVSQSTRDELEALGYLGRMDEGSSTSVPEPSLLPDPKDRIAEQNLLHRAMIASEDGYRGQARRALEEVLELDARSPTALLQLGELELKEGEDAKAAEHLRVAREVRPTDATAAFEEGRALEKLNDLPAARDALEASLKLAPGQFPARILLGRVYLQLKDPSSAEDQFEAALLLQPGSLDAQLGLARAQIAQGSLNEAVKELERLTASQSKDARAYDLLAEAYLKLGKETEARQAKIKAQQLHQQPHRAPDR
jgi:arylsulfatase A-like enzyme/Flp pilus assembly protein TadD